MKIEDILELDEKKIKENMKELKRRIPTIPGNEYLKTRLKEFSVQPWPFILYMVYWMPEVLNDALERYNDYDGAENYWTIIEKLKEEYILGKLLSSMREQQEKEDIETQN